MSWRTLALTLVFLSVFACSPKNHGATEIKIISSDGEELTVFADLAISRTEKRIGLAGRDRIKTDQAMLYIYGTNKYPTFTMRGARNDLSIAFLDSTGLIVEIYNMIIDPNIVYRPSVKCRYALQAAYDWYAQNNVQPGSHVFLPDEIKRIKPIF